MSSPHYRWHQPLLVRLSIVLHALALAAVLLQPAWWQWALGAVVANHALISLVGLWPRSTWLGPNWRTLPQAAMQRHQFALTIDDGPDPQVTPQVLAVLEQWQCRATFFCIGELAERHPELCRDIVQRGHAVENHSQRHRHHFSLLGPQGYARELQAAQATLSAITGRTPRFFRAPAGLRNPFLQPVLARLGLQLASWSVRAYDTRQGDAAKVSRKLLAGLRPGAILLLHDGHAARDADGRPVILAVLPVLLQAARERGLQAVTLEQAAS